MTMRGYRALNTITLVPAIQSPAPTRSRREKHPRRSSLPQPEIRKETPHDFGEGSEYEQQKSTRDHDSACRVDRCSFERPARGAFSSSEHSPKSQRRIVSNRLRRITRSSASLSSTRPSTFANRWRSLSQVAWPESTARSNSTISLSIKPSDWSDFAKRMRSTVAFVNTR
jgi:hypothetical protein